MTVLSDLGMKSERLRIMNYPLLLIFALLLSTNLVGQDTVAKILIDSTDTVALTDSLPKPIIPGTAKKVNHEILDTLSAFDLATNKGNCPNTVKGYRVQIFSCSGSDCQEKADNLYNQFLIAFPDIAAHKLWDPPSIKVRVGDCRNRFEAEAIKNQIKADFPFLFVVNDFIVSPYQVECEVKE